MEMVENALRETNDQYGSSRTFIRCFIFNKYKIPSSPYYVKRLNQILQTGVDQKKIAIGKNDPF